MTASSTAQYVVDAGNVYFGWVDENGAAIRQRYLWLQSSHSTLTCVATGCMMEMRRREWRVLLIGQLQLWGIFTSGVKYIKLFQITYPTLFTQVVCEYRAHNNIFMCTPISARHSSSLLDV